MRSAIFKIEQKVNRLQEQSKLWVERAVTERIFLETDLDLLNATRQNLPHQLFGPDQERPLVVAFFGGTGVGKSSLLNRFADQPIARVGIERPTSREVTLYLHKELEVKTLPKDFPLYKVNIRQHSDEQNREILLIDMPDIDSVESSNGDTVREWIPYIDLLIYVVSPERYRDDRGWRFLLDYGYQHAWLFVINQWDQVEGEQEKISLDFEAILADAGFKEPLVYHTDCLNVSEEEQGDFHKLQETLQKISNEHNIAEFERRGISTRLFSLQKVLEQLLRKLGQRETFEQLEQYHQESWSQATSNLYQHLELPMQQLAAKYQQPSAQWFSFISSLQKNKKIKLDEDTEEIWDREELTAGISDLWDDWAQTKLISSLNKLVWQADSLGLPARTLKKKLKRLRSSTSGRVESRLLQGLQDGLANPGSDAQRLCHRIFGVLTTALPLGALAWVAYRVVAVFSDSNDHEYLGMDFAIHGAVLTLLAWLIPFFLHRRLEPSLSKSAQKGLNTGLTEALAEIDAEADDVLQQVRKLHNDLLTRGTELIADCQAKSPVESQIDETTLARMLQKELQGEDSLPKIGDGKA